MYSILRTFHINRIFAARTMFSIEWSHYGLDGVCDGEKHERSTVQRHSVLQAQFAVKVECGGSFEGGWA